MDLYFFGGDLPLMDLVVFFAALALDQTQLVMPEVQPAHRIPAGRAAQAAKLAKALHRHMADPALCHKPPSPSPPPSRSSSFVSLSLYRQSFPIGKIGFGFGSDPPLGSACPSIYMSVCFSLSLSLSLFPCLSADAAATTQGPGTTSPLPLPI